MITRKAFVTKLQKMHPDVVLFEGYRRSTEQSGGYRGAAAEGALEKVIEGGVVGFSQSHYYTPRGMCYETPKWFRQLYTDLAWGTGDITVGSILYALACAKKPAKKAA
jgi:hypothetical protein